MSEENPHILVVDDDDRLRRLLQKYLKENGFNVSTACDAQDARTKLALLEFDLIVLDVMMPGESGLEFAASFRQGNTTPILMLTAMSESDDRISGLESGADDYLTKPFEPRELLLRLRNILKRVVREPAVTVEEVIRLGDAHFDTARQELTVLGEVIRLTSAEAGLLNTLASPAGRIRSREELADLSGAGGTERAIDVQVTRLRKKIEQDPKAPRYLQTVRGQGYVLRPDG